MALQTFSHLGICVADLDRSTRFYVDVLGFRELFSMDFDGRLAATMERDGAFTSRMLARDDVRLELLHWHDGPATGDGERRAMNARGVTHLCFRLDEATELLDIAERSGGTAWPATLTSIDGAGENGQPLRTVYLTDPDGVRIECISGMPDLSAL